MGEAVKDVIRVEQRAPGIYANILTIAKVEKGQ